MQRSIDALYGASVPAIGWLAAIMVLTGYILMMSKRVSADGVIYLTLNAAGSAGLGLTTIAAHAWQSAAVNVLWLAFGIAPLGRAVASKVRRVRQARAAAVQARASEASGTEARRFPELHLPAPIALHVHRGRRGESTRRIPRQLRDGSATDDRSSATELTRAA